MVVTAVPNVEAPVSAVPTENLQQNALVPAQGSDGGESEYESADDEELGEEEEEDDDELLILPDGVGIGEDNKQLDDDEDRKNPQYIPKKGTFYEHDDRTAAEEDDVEKPPEEPVVKKETVKKKVWKEDNKWNHDKFNEFDQAPKSRDELVSVYGYDIRNEEGPPRARRRRRYGRGPNKYTRNWEDLDAYAKPTRGAPARGGGPGRGGNRSHTGSRKSLNAEEFPALNSPLQKIHQNDASNLNSAESYSPKHDTQRSVTEDHTLNNDSSKHHPQQSPMQHQYNQQNRVSSNTPQADHYGMRARGGRGRGRGGGRGINRDQHRHNDDRGGNNHESPGGGGVGRGNRGGHLPKGIPQHQPHVEEITSDMKNVNLNSQNREERYKKNRGGGNAEGRRNTVPPRLQESAAAAANLHGRGRGNNNASPGGDASGSSRPKRYSSQRQRSIPDQAVPPFQQQQQGYIDPSLEAEPFLGRPPAPRMFPPVTQSPHLVMGGPLGAPPVGGPLGAPPVGGPLGAPPVGGPLGAPPVGAPPVPTGPPVTGPPFIPHEINYAAHPGPQPGPQVAPLPGAAPLAGPHPPQFPPFQGFTPCPVSQPGEIYSNGVTYYNTESQQQVPRINVPLLKRPKAAIPIVPPPERKPREEGSAPQVEGDQDDADIVLEDVSQESSERELANMSEVEHSPIIDGEYLQEKQLHESENPVIQHTEDNEPALKEDEQVETVKTDNLKEQSPVKSEDIIISQEKDAAEENVASVEKEIKQPDTLVDKSNVDDQKDKIDPVDTASVEGEHPSKEVKSEVITVTDAS